MKDKELSVYNRISHSSNTKTRPLCRCVVDSTQVTSSTLFWGLSTNFNVK